MRDHLTVIHRVFLVFVFANFGCAYAQEYEFNPSVKQATPTTKEANSEVYDQLDFDDMTAFENARRGFVAPLLNEGVIDGVYDAPSFNFMQNKKAPDTVNPSLWRHAQLTNSGGLFEVLPDKIYQVRGQDLVNLTIIETANGIVLYDPQYTSATAQASIKLYEQHRGKRELKGVIISHSHADHFGGFQGIVDAGLAKAEDFSNNKIPLIAPKDFVIESVVENVMFGNIMARRAGYQYGNVLQPGETGLVTAALGPALASGNSGLPIPNTYITELDGQKIDIDGVTFEFFLTPDAEAPAEMVFWISDWNALSMAEEVNHLQHNIYTLRGAQTRDANVWSAYISDAIARFGDEVEVTFGPHTWPVWGNSNVVDYLKDQRNLYKSIYDTVVRYANHGYRPDEIAQNAQLPAKVFGKWNNRPYYGNTVNNLKSTYVRNLGWFDGNAAEIALYPDAQRGQRYVNAIGGEDAVVSLALESFQAGDYRFAVDLLNNIVAYTGKNEKANYLMADAFEQLGYQAENALYRNLYLSAANELRIGGGVANELSTTSPEVIAGLPTPMFMQFMTAMVDQIAAQEAGNFVVDLTLDNGAQFSLDMHNGIVNYVSGYVNPNTDVTVTTTKLGLLSLISGASSLSDLKSDGKLDYSGNEQAITALLSVFDLEIRGDMNLVLPLQKENQIDSE